MQEQGQKLHCIIQHCYTQCPRVLLLFLHWSNLQIDIKTSELHAVVMTLKRDIHTSKEGEWLSWKAALKDRRLFHTRFFFSHSSGLRPHSCTKSWAQVAKSGQDGNIYDIAIRAMAICDHAIGDLYFIGGHNQLCKEVTVKHNNKLIQEQILSWESITSSITSAVRAFSAYNKVFMRPNF